MNSNTAMIKVTLQAEMHIFRYIIWCTCRRYATTNVELYFLPKVGYPFNK